MRTGASSSERISIVPPAGAGEKLLFRVFDQATPIGYARLSRIKARTKRPDNVVDMFDPDGYESFELKMIEIAQNYRHQGVGTTLLREIISYCRARNIRRLTGEIKGETRTLRHWYRNNGFTIDSSDRIELLPTSQVSGNGCAAT